MELKKYHKRGPEGIPSSIKIPEGFYTLQYSKHAIERFQERHGNDPVYPRILNIIKDRNVIEVYTEDNIKPAQLLVSLQYRRYTRIYLVIIPFENKVAFVKTLWFSTTNKKDKYEESNSDVKQYPITPDECSLPEAKAVI